MTEWVGDQGPLVRVSDAERGSVAAVLREQSGDGRLTLDELSERLERTFADMTEDGPEVARELHRAERLERHLERRAKRRRW